MRAMKDSGIEWIGEIPEDWETKKVKYLVSYNDEVLAETTDKNYQFLYIDIGAVENNLIVNPQEMTFNNAPSRARRVVKRGDVIVSTVRTYLKAVAKITEIYDNQVASTGFIVLRAIKDNVDSSFLYYSILSESFIGSVVANSVGISYPAINSTNFVALKVVLPKSLIEQQRIASYLDSKCSKIDNIIAKQQQLIEKLKEYKQAVITEAVTKGLNPDVPMKDSGIEWIGEIPEEWKVCKFKYLGKFVSGYAFPSSSFTDNGVLVMKISNIQPMKVVWEEKAYINSDYYETLPEYRVESGNLVFALTRPIINGGIKVAIFEETNSKVLLNQRNAMFKGLDIVKPRWLYYVMQNAMYVQEFEKYIDGTGQQPNISTYEIANIPIPLPSLELQINVVTYLDSKMEEINNSVFHRQQLITKLQEYKKSLIYEVVTGKREVPNG